MEFDTPLPLIFVKNPKKAAILNTSLNRGENIQRGEFSSACKAMVCD